MRVPSAVDTPAPGEDAAHRGTGTVMDSLAVPSGASVAVFGAGAVGLAALMAARIAGAEPIIAVDINPLRLDLALEPGATHAVDGRRGEGAERMAGITGGGVDHVLEITGSPGMHRLALEILNPGGTAAFFTGERGAESLPGGRKALGVIQGDAVPQRFIPRLIELYRAGRFPFDRLVKFYDFGDINRAMAEARRGATVKPVPRIGDP